MKDEEIQEKVKFAIDHEIAVRGFMTRQQVSEVVKETLTMLGVSSKPEDAQADMLFLRQLRAGSEKTNTIIKTSAIGVFVTSGLWFIFDSIKKAIGH